MADSNQAVSPTDVELQRGNVLAVEARPEGYEVAGGYRDRITNDVVVMSALVGGAVTSGIDHGSGAACDIQSASLKIRLVPVQATPAR